MNNFDKDLAPRGPIRTGWAVAAILIVLGTQAVYSAAYCGYSLSRSLIFTLLLLSPAGLWLIFRRNAACIAACAGLLPWIIWENHIQCISDSGPFSGSFGPLYLIVLGGLSSIVVGFVGWLFFDRFRAQKPQKAEQTPNK